MLARVSILLLVAVVAGCAAFDRPRHIQRDDLMTVLDEVTREQDHGTGR